MHMPPTKPVKFVPGLTLNTPLGKRVIYDEHVANQNLPARCDYTTKVTEWPMYLNNEIGDCSIAGAAHAEEVWSTYGIGTTYEPTNTDVLQAYCAVSGYDPTTGANDNGAVLKNVLNYWHTVGISGHQILAYANLDVTDEDEMKHALYYFGPLYVGVALPQSAEDQFNAGQDWHYVGDQPIGGHCIILTGYNSDQDTWTGITWGKAVTINGEWLQHYLSEAWVAISKMWLNNAIDLTGVDLESLGAAWASITGEPNPFTPAVSAPAPNNVVTSVLNILEKAVNDILGILEGH